MGIGIIISIVSITIAIIALIRESLHSKRIEKLELEKMQRKEFEEYINLTDDEKRKEKNLKNYYRNITQKFEYIHLGGLKNPILHFLPLEKLYIKQRVEYLPAPGMPIKKNLRETLKNRTSKDVETFETAFTRLHKELSDKNKPLKLIIQGPAGSGKTTLLKWIALQCDPERENFFSRKIPIFISLKDLGLYPDHTFRTNNLRNLALNRLSSTNITPSFFDRGFEDDELIFLFDGLDEVSDKNIRLEVLNWLQTQNTGGNTMLITTRQPGLQKSRDIHFLPTIPVYTLKELEPEEIETFLKKWSKNIEIGLEKETSHQNTTEITVRIIHKCLSLIKLIQTNKRLLQLAKNPMLLTIIALLQIHRDQAEWALEYHKIYEECLKLVIELKDYGYPQPEPAMPFETCSEYLSYIAYNLVENRCSEIEPAKIQECLPNPTDQLESFLKDMVQKTGLLYESKGKYGFSHISFLEYLAALYFARKKNPGDILAVLEHQHNGHQAEIFKLFANIAGKNEIEEFFDIIIENLAAKEYWKQMTLWEDCLTNIGSESTRDEIEIKFAKQVLKLLLGTPYEKSEERLIISFYSHYPLFKHAGQLKDKAWKLLNDARHPFVQTIGSSVLHDVGRDEPEVAKKLIETLQHRLDDFEKAGDTGTPQRLYFLYQNNNSIPLIIAGRKNVLDFTFALTKMKSSHSFLAYLVILNFENLLYTLGSLGILKLPELLEILEFLELRGLLKLLDFPGYVDIGAVRDLITLQDFLELRSEVNIRNLLDLPYFGQLQEILEEYTNKFHHQYKNRENPEKIENWVETALGKLHSLPDPELLRYFPGTSPGDLNLFRQGNETKTNQ